MIPNLEVAEMSPWLDLRVPPKEVKLPIVEAQTHRRFLKTHLPVDALVFSPKARYLYIGRDGRDVVWSLYNHHVNANAVWYAALNDTPGRVGPPIDPPPADIRQYWRDWMDSDGFPFWPFWENVRSWWEIRDLPNVLFVHFESLKRDMQAEMRRIAAFLEIAVDASRWNDIVEYCSFDWMKRNATKSVPLAGAFWDAGARGVHQQRREWSLARHTDAVRRGGVRSARDQRTGTRLRCVARNRSGAAALNRRHARIDTTTAALPSSKRTQRSSRPPRSRRRSRGSATDSCG